MRDGELRFLCRMRYHRGMTLGEYLKKHRISDAGFAAQAGMHRTEVWKYRTGKRVPRAGKVAAIEQATDGQVRAKDFAEQ